MDTQVDTEAIYSIQQGQRQLPKSGGVNSTIVRCRRQCIEMRSADQSARSAEKCFAFIFSYQNGLSWHLRALHCKLETPAPKKRGDIAAFESVGAQAPPPRPPYISAPVQGCEAKDLDVLLGCLK